MPAGPAAASGVTSVLEGCPQMRSIERPKCVTAKRLPINNGSARTRPAEPETCGRSRYAI